MRDLTLIVTDCHAPPDLGREALASLERLPTAELLRARGTRLAGGADWWLALLTAVGVGAPDADAAPLAVAAIAWYGISGQRDENLWLATPVRLTAAINHVQLAAIGTAELQPFAALIDDFNRDFAADGVRLRRGATQHLFLEAPREVRAVSVDPGRIVGGDLGESLPSGPDGPYLRRLMTEIQMWLHSRIAEDASCNALWLWGGGGVWPELGGLVLPAAATSEPLVRGLWRLAGAQCVEPVDGFAAARGLAVQSLLVTLSLENWRTHGEPQPLQRLEREWLAPAWAALAAGRLGAFRLGLNGVLSQVTRRQSWRIWRTRRHWAES